MIYFSVCESVTSLSTAVSNSTYLTATFHLSVFIMAEWNFTVQMKKMELILKNFRILNIDLPIKCESRQEVGNKRK